MNLLDFAVKGQGHIETKCTSLMEALTVRRHISYILFIV